MEQEIYDTIYDHVKKIYKKAVNATRLRVHRLFETIQIEIEDFMKSDIVKWAFECNVYSRFASQFNGRKDYIKFMKYLIREFMLWVYTHPSHMYIHFSKCGDKGVFSDKLSLLISKCLQTYKTKADESDVDDESDAEATLVRRNAIGVSNTTKMVTGNGMIIGGMMYGKLGLDEEDFVLDM